MKPFDLGPGVPVDPALLIDTRMLVQCNSGGGKSFLLRRLLEQTHGQVQQLVIDPEGEFSTLRERFDYVLAAHQGGDTAAHPRSAKLLAERLLELGVSAILDIYELKAHDRIRFVRAFLEALVDAPKRLWHPALVVVDEAHLFCPQVGEAESAGAVIDLATRGRKRGFCAILATQRLSKLHKDAAAECNNKLIGRTGLDVDMKRAGDELGFVGREQLHQLRNLKPGEFFAFGPALTPAVTQVKVGAVQTSHPKAGARLASPPPPPRARVKALLPQLADLPAEAETRARTLDELQREVTALKRELTKARKGVPTEVREKVVEKRVEVPVLKDGQLDRLEKLAARLQEVQAPIADALTVLRRQPTVGVPHSGPNVSPRAAIVPQKRRPVSPAAEPVRTAAASNGALPSPQQRILDTLAYLEALGLERPARAQLALWCEVSPTSGGFFNNLGSLRSAGLIDYPAGGQVALTDAGRDHATASGPVSVEAMQEALCVKVGNAKAAIVRALIAAYPGELSRDELAETIGVSRTSGGYFNNLGALRTLGVIDYPRPGFVVATPVLFLDGAA